MIDILRIPKIPWEGKNYQLPNKTRLRLVGGMQNE